MSVVAIISACSPDAATRSLILTHVAGKPVVCHAYESAKATGLFSDVIVVTNDDRVVTAINAINGNVVPVKAGENSMESAAKVALTVVEDIIVYINGNIPFVEKSALQKLIEQFDGALGKNIHAASMVQKIQDTNKISDSNCVKVTLDLRLFALYFSRSPIPYIQNSKLTISYYQHINVYAFRKAELLKTIGWPESPLERTENIEVLRLLENGIQIKMLINQFNGVEINTTADIAEAEAMLSKTS